MHFDPVMAKIVLFVGFKCIFSFRFFKLETSVLEFFELLHIFYLKVFSNNSATLSVFHALHDGILCHLLTMWSVVHLYLVAM